MEPNTPFHMCDYIIIFPDNSRKTGSIPCPGATPADSGRFCAAYIKRKFPGAEDYSVFPSNCECKPTAPLNPPSSATRTWYSSGY